MRLFPLKKFKLFKTENMYCRISRASAVNRCEISMKQKSKPKLPIKNLIYSCLKSRWHKGTAIFWVRSKIKNRFSFWVMYHYLKKNFVYTHTKKVTTSFLCIVAFCMFPSRLFTRVPLSYMRSAARAAICRRLAQY